MILRLLVVILFLGTLWDHFEIFLTTVNDNSCQKMDYAVVSIQSQRVYLEYCKTYLGLLSLSLGTCNSNSPSDYFTTITHIHLALLATLTNTFFIRPNCKITPHISSLLQTDIFYAKCQKRSLSDSHDNTRLNFRTLFKCSPKSSQH